MYNVLNNVWHNTVQNIHIYTKTISDTLWFYRFQIIIFGLKKSLYFRSDESSLNDMFVGCNQKTTSVLRNYKKKPDFASNKNKDFSYTS